MYYKFKEELKNAVIINRPNRFIMEIIIDGKKEKAHCPSTGRIGKFTFKNNPCLVSVSDNSKRKTRFTVEAIAPEKPKIKKRTWVGINQGRSNVYVEFFLKNNFFFEMVKNGEKTIREKKLGDSRIDFKVENNFVEVKTFLGNIPFGDRDDEYLGTASLDRLIKHFSDLAKYSKAKKGKAIVLICNMYDAKKFEPPKNAGDSKVGKTVKKALKDGVENWQVNLKINEKGVKFLNYFKLDLINKI